MNKPKITFGAFKLNVKVPEDETKNSEPAISGKFQYK